MDTKYTAMSIPPENALKEITAGTLKGKYDINPQWRIETLTENFGLCGIGWKYEIATTHIEPLSSGEILLFMTINLYIKEKEAWSDAIPGCGGDFIVNKNKNGLVANDEAFKMCLTDALGNAAKNIGVAANIYRGFSDSKYIGRAAKQEVVNAKEYVKTINGATHVINQKGQYVPLNALGLDALNAITNNKAFAACHNEARTLMLSMENQV